MKTYHTLWMDIAIRISRESHCIRKKVGAIAVKDDKIISIGWNGTYAGHDNCCEDPVDGQLVTKPTVIHAESNLLGKLAGSYESAKDATIYVTCAPCLECAKQLAVAKVKEVIYNEEYRGVEGIHFLKSCNIPITQLSQ